jgi:hypothetical protein
MSSNVNNTNNNFVIPYNNTSSPNSSSINYVTVENAPNSTSMHNAMNAIRRIRTPQVTGISPNVRFDEGVRIRRVREFHNAQYKHHQEKSKVNFGSFDQNYYRELSEDYDGDTTEGDESVPRNNPNQPRPPEIVTRISVVDRFNHIFTGATFIADFNTKNTVASGTQINCFEIGLGYVDVSSYPERNIHRTIIQPVIDFRSIEGYSYVDDTRLSVSVQAKTFEINLHFLALLERQLPGKEANQLLMGSVLAQGIRYMSNCPSIYNTIITNTSQYYIELVRRRYYTLLIHPNNQRIYRNNFSEIMHYKVNTSVHTDCGSTFVEHMNTMLQIDDVNCDVVVDWSKRDDFVVLSSSDVEVENWFDFKITKPRKVVRHDTACFRIIGSDSEDWVSFDKTNHNLNKALKRAFAQRNGENLYRRNAIRLGNILSSTLTRDDASEVEKLLRGSRNLEFTPPMLVNKMHRVSQNISRILQYCHLGFLESCVGKWRGATNWAYYSIYKNMLTCLAPVIPRTASANIQHVKKKLRQAFIGRTILHNDADLMVRRMDVELKREIAKPGKVPRLFCSYDAGCMYSPELPEFVKVCINGHHFFHINGSISLDVHIYIMSKPKTGDLSKIFELLIDGVGVDNSLFWVIYSDDSCVSGKVAGKSFMYNVDVASNDSSQDVPAFLCCYLAMSQFHQQRGLGLIKQCLTPMSIEGPEGGKLLVQFKGPFEGSGSTLTTILNHFGSTLICLAAAEFIADGELDIQKCIRDGGALVGHEVTIDECIDCDHNQLQFLKHSPAIIEGKIIPVQNVSCILRSLGRVNDNFVSSQFGVTADLFSSYTNEIIMENFTGGVIKGWCHESNHLILSSLRQRFLGGSKPPEPWPVHIREHVILGEQGDFSIWDSTEHLCNRYDVTREELNDLCTAIGEVKLGDVISSSVIAKFNAKDYGCRSLKPPEGLSPLEVVTPQLPAINIPEVVARRPRALSIVTRQPIQI